MLKFRLAVFILVFGASLAAAGSPSRNYTRAQARADWEQEAWRQYPEVPPAQGSGLKWWWDSCKAEVSRAWAHKQRQIIVENGMLKHQVSVRQHVRYAEKWCRTATGDQYLGMFLHREGSKGSMKDKIARAHFPDDMKGKPLYVVVLGNNQFINGPASRDGFVELYEWLRDAGFAVVMFKCCNTWDDTRNYLRMNGEDYVKEVEVVRQHIWNLLKVIIRDKKPSEIRMAGFSRGASIINWLSRHQGWRPANVPVTRTVGMDVIHMRNRELGIADRDRPNFANNSHLNIYQRVRVAGGVGRVIKQACKKLFAMQGDSCNERWAQDPPEVRVTGVPHNSMDNHRSSLVRIWNHLIRS